MTFDDIWWDVMIFGNIWWLTNTDLYTRRNVVHRWGVCCGHVLWRVWRRQATLLRHVTWVTASDGQKNMRPGSHWSYISEANESNEHPTAIDLEDLKVATIPHHFLSLPGAMTMRFGVVGLGGPEPPMAVAASSSKTLKARKITAILLIEEWLPAVTLMTHKRIWRNLVCCGILKMHCAQWLAVVPALLSYMNGYSRIPSAELAGMIP